MTAFIEQNRKLLVFYYWAARIGGWLFITLVAAAGIGHSIALISRMHDAAQFQQYWRYAVPWGMFNQVLPCGILVLGISQLIWYLLEADHPTRWILRHAHQLLYIYTAITMGYFCWAGFMDVRIHFNQPHDFPWRIILLTLFFSVKVLMLIGVAEILRRILPMIDESRTLV